MVLIPPTNSASESSGEQRQRFSRPRKEWTPRPEFRRDWSPRPEATRIVAAATNYESMPTRFQYQPDPTFLRHHSGAVVASSCMAKCVLSSWQRTKNFRPLGCTVKSSSAPHSGHLISRNSSSEHPEVRALRISSNESSISVLHYLLGIGRRTALPSGAIKTLLRCRG